MSKAHSRESSAASNPPSPPNPIPNSRCSPTMLAFGPRKSVARCTISDRGLIPTGLGPST